VYEWVRPPWAADFPVIDDLADIGLMTKDKGKAAGKQAVKISTDNALTRDRHPKVQATIETVLGKLAAAPGGERNTTLNEAAYTLGGLIAAGQLPRVEAEQMLSNVALAIGLGQNETAATIRSGINAGEAAPLEIKDTPLPGPTAPAAEDRPPADLLSYPAADEGNAQAVLLLHGGSYLYTNEIGWLYYNGKHWTAKGSDERLNRAIVDTLIERRTQAVKADLEPVVKATKPSANNVRNCKFMLQSLLWASIDDFDNDPDLLNCANGIVNLRTGELAPHGHEHRFTYCIGTNYDPAADDSAWAEWVYSSVTPAGCDDNGQYAELAAWLQMAAGYSLTGHTHEQCLFYLQGPPRAGKGVFLQTLEKLLGRPLSSGVDFDTFTGKRAPDSQNFDLAPLKTCRLITATESERTTMLNAKRVKSITGNDPVYCSHKHRDFFTYTPQYKIWLSSNFRVLASADDDGLWSRLRIIHFPNSHLVGKEDFGLEARLWKQRTAILKWAIDGAMEWYERKDKNIGLGRPEIIT
jgi:putative DNA primase/helicase